MSGPMLIVGVKNIDLIDDNEHYLNKIIIKKTFYIF